MLPAEQAGGEPDYQEAAAEGAAVPAAGIRGQGRRICINKTQTHWKKTFKCHRKNSLDNSFVPPLKKQKNLMFYEIKNSF